MKLPNNPVASIRARITWEVLAYVSLMLIAFIMRLWQLGERAVHYDEGIHIGCGWNIFTHPASWCLDPWVHGPFQFIGTGIIYNIFGDSEFTARLLPAIFGTAIVILPSLLRRQLGRWGALSAAVLLAFSPLLMYYSRYARGDIYTAFFTLLLVVCIWNYIADGKQRWLYTGAAALSLSFSALETTYINLAIIVLFLIIISAKELALRIPKWLDLKGLSPKAEVTVLLVALVLPLFAVFINVFPMLLKKNLINDLSHPVAIGLVIFAFCISAGLGLKCNPRRWIISMAVFYGIFITVWSVFFTHLEGISVGLWGDATYWIGQHNANRGGQPWFYYIMLIPIYEFLPLLFAFAGAIYYAIKGNLFSRFLIYWTVAGFIIFSFFGEKMPWISLQMVVPVILLGGMFIGFLMEGLRWKRTGRLKEKIPSKEKEVQSKSIAWVVVCASALIVAVLLFSYTAYVSCKESYQVEDDPPQMLFYAGESYDVARIAAKIDALALETGEGHNLSVTVDSGLYEPDWHWYLKDYVVDTPDLSSITFVPRGSVLILATDHVPADSQYLEKYGEGERFKMILWFPEEYKNGFSLGWWWNYFLHRETAGPYWKGEAVVYFPKGN